uniref:Uncharacterized protein n=1 Tax=Oreochromis aureus TaxID=47969 RepID=A0AAZ1XAK3_OREAU
MEGNRQYIQHNTHTDREEDQGTMTLPLQLFREFLEQPQQSAVGQPQEPSAAQQQLREEMVIPPSVPRDHEGRNWGEAVIPKLKVGDDIEQYLITFERLAVVYHWPEVEWTVRLVPYLSGRARVAYVAIAAEDTEDYKKVKDTTGNNVKEKLLFNKKKPEPAIYCVQLGLMGGRQDKRHPATEVEIKPPILLLNTQETTSKPGV